MLLFLIGLAGAAGADAPAAAILDRARAAQGTFATLRARFEQERTISLVDQVVRSSGEFLLDRKGRVVWTVEEPERLRVVLGASGIFVGGKRIDGQVPAGVGPLAVARGFADFFAGTAAELERDFSLSVVGEDRVRLVPRRPELGRWLAAIEIAFAGERRLPFEILLEEIEGDRTRIHFAAVELDPKLEARAFEP